MIFELTINNHGTLCTWYYDNISNIVYNQFRENITPMEPLQYKKVVPFDRNFNPNKKSKENYLLEISLGLKCNFHCQYCSQTAYRGLAYSSSPKDVPVFIEKLKKSGLNCRRIQLWGGEPMVYWKVIEKLVPELRALYPNAHISAPSNGSLLTREKVDFMKKYNMYLYISHDGCEKQLRGKNGTNDDDILENPKILDAIRYAQTIFGENYIAFGATPTRDNCNSEKIIKFFKRKVGPKTKVSTHNIVRCHNSSEPLGVASSFVPPNALHEYSDSVYKVLCSGNQEEGEVSLDGDYSLWRKRQSLMERLYHGMGVDSIWAECQLPSPHGLIVDMKGNVLQCHNHPIQDSASGMLDDLEHVVSNGYIHVSKKKRCLNCLVVNSCYGGCPSADDRANELACPNLYALHWGIFRATFKRLFDVELLDYKVINN